MFPKAHWDLTGIIKYCRHWCWKSCHLCEIQYSHPRNWSTFPRIQVIQKSTSKNVENFLPEDPACISGPLLSLACTITSNHLLKLGSSLPTPLTPRPASPPPATSLLEKPSLPTGCPTPLPTSLLSALSELSDLRANLPHRIPSSETPTWIVWGRASWVELCPTSTQIPMLKS